jgi:hypothetical protein
VTPDPYEVLGVDVGASHDEIAAAYRHLAARHHPDRHVGAAPEELARLQRRMAAINEAYATLRALPPPPPSPPPPQSEGNTGRIPTPIAFEEQAARVPWSEPRRRRRRWPYLLLVFAILGATFGVVAAATATHAPKGVSSTWGVGSCVQGTSDLTPVRCDGPHDGKITNVETDAKDCPATTDGFVPDRGYIWCIDTDQ